MAYLLDSNIIIPYLADDPAIVQLVERLASQGIAISIITYLEIWQGTFRSPDPAAAQAQFDRFMALVPVLPFSLSSARRCARLREDLARQGKRVRPRALDLIIAAIAIEHGYTLVTYNRKDYDDIPQLVLYDAS